MEQDFSTSAQFLASATNQFSFISALIGGFSIALIAGLINLERKRITDWSIGFLIVSSIVQIGCTFFLSFLSFKILTLSGNANYKVLNEFLSKIDPKLSLVIIAFLLSFYSFIISIGLLGWIRSKKLGILSSIVATVVGIISIFAMRILFSN
jgi:hypothetical protein